MPTTLDDECWEDLLGHVRQGVLLPIIGPGLLTTGDDTQRPSVTHVHVRFDLSTDTRLLARQLLDGLIAALASERVEAAPPDAGDSLWACTARTWSCGARATSG